MSKQFQVDWTEKYFLMIFEDGQYKATFTHEQAMELAQWIKKQYLVGKKIEKSKNRNKV